MKIPPHERISHSLLKHLVKLRSSSKYRFHQRTTFCRGRSIAEDLLRYNTHLLAQDSASQDKLIPIKRLILSSKALSAVNEDNAGILSLVSNLPREHRPQLYASNAMLKLSDAAQVGDQEVVAEVGMSAPQDLLHKALTKEINFLLVLDGVQDPLNVGTLIRSCLYLGWDGVISTNGSADCYNEKVVRASMGAVYHMPVQSFTDLKVLSVELRKMDTLVAATRLPSDGKGFDSKEESRTAQTARCLILGNEALGVSSLLRGCGASVEIPRPTAGGCWHLQCDSLNVNAAGAVLMQQLGPLRGALTFQGV
eukprot:gb/GECG01011718.1/.p1 GENE.gb/GECG01011718.1/~~gb/GECG01011718.1/.p1  ORF type:complete len:309 (+),score=25.44 gb/GECG01011718.1/:1-927(+)